MVPPLGVGALRKLHTPHIGSGGTDFYRPRYHSFGPQRGRGLSPPSGAILGFF